MCSSLAPRIGFAMTGSFCTFSKAFEQAEALAASGADLIPIMSFNAASISSRFGAADENKNRLAGICGKSVITDIEGAEPIGPKRLFDVLAVVPCTGNTLAKLAVGITDTPVTMAVKAHRRNSRPVVLCIATNDGLSGSAKNIATLANTKGYFFVPFEQDDATGKPFSLVSDFSRLGETISLALSDGGFRQ